MKYEAQKVQLQLDSSRFHVMKFSKQVDGPLLRPIARKLQGLRLIFLLIGAGR
jgi:hypothetical protein